MYLCVFGFLVILESVGFFYLWLFFKKLLENEYEKMFKLICKVWELFFLILIMCNYISLYFNCMYG